jgi:hypothetical protein
MIANDAVVRARGTMDGAGGDDDGRCTTWRARYIVPLRMDVHGWYPMDFTMNDNGSSTNNDDRRIPPRTPRRTPTHAVVAGTIYRARDDYHECQRTMNDHE